MNQVIHGKWNFEYKPNKFIYQCTPETVCSNEFKLYDINNNQKAMDDLMVEKFRKAAILHRLVRNKIRDKMHNSVLFTDITNCIPETLNQFCKNKTDEKIGSAFPCGISVNEVIAHDTAKVNDTRVLNTNDIVKIDFGIHVDGCIIDSAFTEIIDGDDHTKQYYSPLLEASMDATYTGISLSGVDARLYEISEGISEVISSYELDDGTPVKPIFGLGGHNILPYQVHGKKLILSVPHKTQKGLKMEENEIYAIETYASTGNGKPNQMPISKCNHFMIDENISSNFKKLTTKEQKNPLLNWIIKDNNKLPFTQEWCKHINKYDDYINYYVGKKGITAFPPLTDTIGSKTSQYEHTIHIKSNCVEVLSLGKDY